MTGPGHHAALRQSLCSRRRCVSAALYCPHVRLTGMAQHDMPVREVLLHGVCLTLLGGKAERSIGMGLHSTV